ncbi:MAG: hypothetical protein AB7S93_07400 [Xanthobacteraceae bacterium]
METPVQSAPVERLYMRLMVGRKGKPDRPVEEYEPPKKRGKGEKRPHGKRAGDFLLELTTFHIRPRRRTGV